MGPWYVNRDVLKDACEIPATSTGNHWQIDGAIEGVSRLIDDWVGFHLYPALETRYFSPTDPFRLHFERTPLTSITTLRTDFNGDGVYETTWTATGYLLSPPNAPSESPPEPYWTMELRPQSTVVFPVWSYSGRGWPNLRGVQIIGTFGYFDQHEASPAKLSTGISSGTTSFEMASASMLHPGQTILVENERMFINEIGSAASGPVQVLRAQQGTSADAHASGVVPDVYKYPIVERAALYQAQFDFHHAIGEAAGGAHFGRGAGAFDPDSPAVLGVEGDLHPAVRRMLRGFRTLVVA